jgi:hypothetical protein
VKSKILITFFVILLILALPGCGMVAPGCPAWMVVEDTVTNYWQAIINRQYELAKWYCVPNGVWYNKVDEWEEYINVNSEGETSLIIYLDKFYNQTEIIGGDIDNIYDPDIIYEAIAYVKIITHKRLFIDSYVTDIDVFEYETELIKQNYPPGDWELK